MFKSTSSKLVLVAGILFFLALDSICQPMYIDVRAKNRGYEHLYSADSFYLGESFIYTDTAKDIEVWLNGNKAGWTGDLFYVRKDRFGRDMEIFLMSNKHSRGYKVNVTRLVRNQGYRIKFGEEVYFKYVVQRWFGYAADQAPKYTGENLPDDDFVSPMENFRHGGNRWAIAGKVNADTAEFAFEDIASHFSDFDYSDIVFGVSGLRLMNHQETKSTYYILY